MIPSCVVTKDNNYTKKLTTPKKESSSFSMGKCRGIDSRKDPEYKIKLLVRLANANKAKAAKKAARLELQKWEIENAAGLNVNGVGQTEDSAGLSSSFSSFNEDFTHGSNTAKTIGGVHDTGRIRQSDYSSADVFCSQFPSARESAPGNDSAANGSSSSLAGDTTAGDSPNTAATGSRSATATTDASALQQRFVDPAVFVEWLTGQPLDEWQRATARDFGRHPRVARCCCNGAGKTRLIAGLLVWWLLHPESRCVVTAGVYRQLGVMRDEIGRCLHKLTGWRLLEHELIHPDGVRKAVWYSADHPGLFEGQHATNLALFLDEAKSIPPGIRESSERLQASRTLAMSSPGAALGWFYDCFTRSRTHWLTATVPASQCPRVSSVWAEELGAIHGVDSALYRSAVLAEFASGDVDGLIQLEHVDRLLRNPPEWRHGQVVAGIDLSASVSGDESVIVVRNGNKITQIIAWHDADAMRVSGRCLVELARLGVPRENVFADSGGLGAGIVSRMQEVGWPVRGIQFGGRPLVASERVANRMTELWQVMADEVEHGRIILPNDDVLVSQLVGRKAALLSSGRLKLESKAEMKKRGLSSPDRADALALALCSPDAGRVTRTFDIDNRTFSHDENSAMLNMTCDGRFDLGM